jgi:WD40 repeat protein
LPEAVAGNIECSYCGSKYRVDYFTNKQTGRLPNFQQNITKPAVQRQPMSKRKLWTIVATIVVCLFALVLGLRIYGRERYFRIINSAAISPDGKRLVSVHGQSYSSGGGTLRVWDSATGKPLNIIDNKGLLMWQVVWSPDGKYLATGEQDGLTEIWNAETMQSSHKLQSSTGFVDNIVWSPDSKQIAAGDDKGVLRVWDVASGKQVFSQPIHTNNIDATAWSPDGKMIATGGWDNKIRVVEAATGSVMMEFTDTSYVESVAWSADSKFLASGGLSNMVYIFDVTKGKELFKLAGHKNSVKQVGWSPDGKFVASVAADDTVRIWDAATGKMSQALENHGYNPNLMWSPDGKYLASGGSGSVRVWDASNWTVLQIRGFSSDNDIKIVGWSADSKQVLAIGTYDEVMKMWEATSGKEIYLARVSFWESARRALF